jgi:hypothetical protein
MIIDHRKTNSMKKLSTFTFLLIAILLSYNNSAQAVITEFDDETGENDSALYHSAGDNFGFTYNENISGNLSYFTADGSLTTLFLHKGFASNFGLTAGVLNVDVLNPELLYFSPSYGFKAADNIHIGLELRTGHILEVSETFFSPTVQISFGSREKHFSIGYSVVSDFDEIETMTIIDGIYLDSAVRFGGRIPLADNISIVSRNQYIDNNGSSNSSSLFATRSGVDFNISNFTIQLMIYYSRFRSRWNNNSNKQGIIGLSYKF